jgi:predicted Zn finger-like uncharacterized protein
MAIQLSCPHCATSYLLAEQQVGQQVRCKKCQGVFQVKMKAAKPSPIADKPAPPPPVLRRAAPDDRDNRDLPEVLPAEDRKSKPAGKPLLLAVVLGGGALAVLLFVGVVGAGVAAWFYLRTPGPAVAAAAAQSEVDAKPPLDVAEPAKDLDELKAATVFVKVNAGALRASGSGFVVKTEGNTG